MPTRIRAWHRHYDPTIGRYTQPDPLGFVDGPSVYAYAGSKPPANVDITGLLTLPQSKPRSSGALQCQSSEQLQCRDRCMKYTTAACVMACPAAAAAACYKVVQYGPLTLDLCLAAACGASYLGCKTTFEADCRAKCGIIK
ncbi:MAG: RHS repeat-associated core domain-containing protein [Hyphomicrobium sp.]